MSYNPYTRAVKESINVDFENRYSNQKVILCNRENKFYGTFIGLIKDSQFELSGGTLTDVRLSNVVILDSEGKEINLSRINERLEDIYYNLDVISSSLKTTISDTIPAISIELNSAISANSVDISSLFSKLVTLSANSSSGLSILESYISSNLYNLSSELSTTKQNIKTNSDEIDYLSGLISTKIFVGNYISNDIKGDYSDLSVLKTTMDEYQQLLVDGRLSTDLSNTIFITTDKNINAFGEKIINLADATELSDAVNLGQVEHIINSVSSNLNSNITEKIWIGNDLSSGEYTNLSVVKVSSDKYQQLLVDGVISSSLSNTLFIVNDDSQINAMGQKITNLKDGTDLSDAVNLGQLKSAQSTTLSGYPDLSSVQWDSLSLGEIGEMLKFIFKKMGGLNS